jgi:hypothetical protein
MKEEQNMKHTMRILTLLMLAIVVGTGQTWGRGGLGYIVFDDSEVTNKGEVTFYTDANCEHAIDFSGGRNGNLTSSDLTAVKDGENNIIGYMVYIKAVPNYDYTLGKADDNGAVTFITAEKTTNVFQAPRRTSPDPTLNLGPDITVTATSERFVYSFVMPASGANVTVHVNFPERAKQSVKYIDVDGELKDSPEAYFIDGSETALGVPGVETSWYVVPAGSVSYACSLPCTGNVNLILADGATMTIGSTTTFVTGSGLSNDEGNINIYGQSQKTGKLTVYAETYGVYASSGNIIINGCEVTAEGYNGICAADGKLTINGGEVNATGEYTGLYAIDDITLTDAVVTAQGNYDGISSELSDIIINGGNVTATSTDEADGHALFVPSGGGKIVITATDTEIENNNHITVSGYEGIVSNSGSISISGFTVEATGITYAIYANGVTLKDANITANGARGIFARADGLTVNGGTIVATGTGDYSAINVLIGDITLTDADITATSENAYAIKVVEGVINGGEPGEVVLQSGALTIIGGKVTATATGTGEDVGGLYADGDIILGWNKTTDFIKATSYDVGDSHTVSVKYGQAFKSEDGTVGCVNTLTNDEVTAIAGLKLIPTGAHRLYTAGTTNEWMTWCCSDELLIPVQLTAYTIEGVINGTVTLSDALTTVPAYTPVLIKRAGKSLAEDIYAAAKEEGTAPDTGYDTATGLAWTTAQGLTFWGNATDATITEGGFTEQPFYSLYNGKFYRYEGTQAIAAHRCILTVSPVYTAPVLTIGTETTSLSPVPSPSREGSSQRWYTLDGRKLNGKPTKKGIYVNGGRKVVIK